MPRGVIAKKRTRVLTVSVAEELIPLIDRAMRKEGVVRSQFVRRAVREKLERFPNLEITPKCLTCHQQARRSANASNIAVLKTPLKDGKVTVILWSRCSGESTNRQTAHNMRQQTKLLWQRWLSPARPGHPRARGAEAATTCRTFPRSPWLFRVTPLSVFSGFTPLFAVRPGVKLPIRQLCSTCV